MNRIDSQTLHRRLQEADPPLLLDVREGWEWEAARIEGSVHLPMSRLAERVRELDPARDTVVVCHHGNRSLVVAQWLIRQGFTRVSDLVGGIDAWARSVDRSVGTY